MATYRLSVSLLALGFDVVEGARVRIDKRRAAIADTYPPTNNLNYFNKATNEDGETFFLLEPDDSSTYHVAKIFDLAGIPIYEKPFSMPPEDANLEDSAIGVTIGGSLIQFQHDGVDLGTPTTVRYINFLGSGVSADYEDTTATFTISGGGGTGFVAITDIQPSNIDGAEDNVGSKVFTDDGFVLQSCVSSTTAIKVYVLAVTGGSSFKPTVLVNDVEADIERNALTDVWQGFIDITLTGDGPYTVRAIHNDGAEYMTEVTLEAPPVITDTHFLNPYIEPSQTEYAAGQEATVLVVSTTEFNAVEFVDDAGSAISYQLIDDFEIGYVDSLYVIAVVVAIANRGNATTAFPALLRIRNIAGTWGEVTSTLSFGSEDGVNSVLLNNTYPSLSFDSIEYPVGQSALKGSETAVVHVTETEVDSIVYTSDTGELSITDFSLPGNKTVTRISGDYNVSTPNISAIVHREANATSQNFSTTVCIADADPVITITTPSARLRSGVTEQNHTITISSTQKVTDVDLTASVGTFIGSWVTANDGLTWTRSLRIADSDTKGAATFSGLSVKNLAGRVVTTITSGDSYTVGGFTRRTISFAAWPNRESAIGTHVSDTSKLRVTNLSKGESLSLNTSFVSNVGDAVNTFTVTETTGVYNATGNLIYNRDLANAVSNTTGLMQFEVEEIV